MKNKTQNDVNATHDMGLTEMSTAQEFLDSAPVYADHDWMGLFYPDLVNQKLNEKRTVKLWQLHWKDGNFRYQFHAEDVE